jgi:hypothetical protein
MVKSVNHTVPRKLQAKIHSEKSNNFSVWNALRNEVDAKYELATNLDDYGNHLIREFNRKISFNVKNQPSFVNLLITPYDAGFRFLGSTFQAGGAIYTETTAYDSANAVILTEASDAIPNSWMNYSSVSYVTFKSTLTSIGYEAFNGCSSLTSVTFPNSLTSIGISAFGSCTGLTSVSIPNSVTSIGTSAFYNCTGLTSLTLSNNLLGIGSSTFYGCNGLISVTIPNSVTSIGSAAFNYCSGIQNLTIGNQVASIGSYAFYGCSGLTSVTIPNSVTSIGEGAFKNCSGLISVTIGSGVTSIGNHAFYYCTGLTSLTIPISTTSIGSYAFYQCNDLSNFNCYAARTIFSSAYYCLIGTSEPFTIHAKSGDTSWIAGSDTIGSTPVTVIKDL